MTPPYLSKAYFDNLVGSDKVFLANLFDLTISELTRVAIFIEDLKAVDGDASLRFELHRLKGTLFAIGAHQAADEVEEFKEHLITSKSDLIAFKRKTLALLKTIQEELRALSSEIQQ